MRVVAQAPCDMVAYLNLHSGLAEINVAAVVQFKAHDAPPKPVRTEKCFQAKRTPWGLSAILA